MSDTVLAAAITAIPGTIAALGTIYAIIRLNRVASSVDGMKDELVTEVRKSATAEGAAIGQSVERERGEEVARELVTANTEAAATQQSAAETQVQAANIQKEAADARQTTEDPR